MIIIINFPTNWRRAQEVVPMAPTPIEVEADDSDHETSDQVTTKSRRSTRTRTTLEWCGNPVLEVMLLDNNENTSCGKRWWAQISTNCSRP